MSLDKEQIAKLSVLLLSPEDSNTQIAFEILQQQGFPKELITEVFAIYKITKHPELKAKAEAILKEHGSKEVNFVMTKKYALGEGKGHMGGTEKTIMKNIIQYTQYNELDGSKLATALYKKFGYGATYLLTNTPPEERKEMLRTFISGTTFRLNGKALTKFPSELFEFTDLTVIDLSDNKITSITKQIEVFTHLKELHLNKNKIAGIHKNITKLKHLEVLDLSRNNYSKELPTHIFECHQLRRLSLIGLRSSSRVAEELPLEFFNMKNLKELSLSFPFGRTYSNFPQISKVIGNPIDLDPLKIADAAYDQGDKGVIAHILKFGKPESIRKVLKDYYNTSTKTMDFSNIYLEHLPVELKEFNIQYLNLSRSKIGARYGQGNLKDEKRFQPMDRERIAVINELTNLKGLNLEYNLLSDLPDLSNLKSLRVLNLSGNSFIDFPAGFFSLSDLEELYMASSFSPVSSSKKEIPSEISNLRGLKKMNVFRMSYRSDRDKTLERLKTLLPGCEFV